MNTKLAPTREAALVQLDAFAAQANTYKKTSGSHLSAYLSHRLLSPSEVASAVLEQHKPQQLDRFLSELCWGTYWRAWLEGRPGVFSHWQRLVAEDSRRWPEREEFQRAISGQTGIDCFDAWVKELQETGLLPHWARSNFASIWIFTLKLPWSLGAAFFLQHLIDGQVASTLMNWRVVGGLQNQGKPLLARAENIRELSQARFNPVGLAESAVSLPSSSLPAFSPGISYPLQVSSQIGEDYALLVTGDDHIPELGAFSALKPKLVMVMTPQTLDEQGRLAEQVREFKSLIAADTKRRAEQHFGCEVVDFSLPSDGLDEFAQSLRERGVTSLAYHEPFLGPSKSLVTSLAARDVGLTFFPVRRTWDAVLSTHAAKGFVHFKKQALPLILRKKGKL